ncbi:hypothetical protein [Mitsuokella multacida]|uniref:hypothetical protein n=1 Tax=Mitsuokella multacida TaxID=52226 RepID=UPI00241FA891|nr:hypothetical protein [Mitsuokella multacida]
MLSFIAFMLLFFILQDDLLSFDGFSIAQFSEYYFLVPARFAHKKKRASPMTCTFLQKQEARWRLTQIG